MSRRAGVLLHPTSLPGPYGIGEIGRAAIPFLDWLESAKQSIWQFLPLGPVDDSASPYTTRSSTARNSLLISLQDLVTDGWLQPGELPEAFGDLNQLDIALIKKVRTPLLQLAAQRVAATLSLRDYQDRHPWVSEWAIYETLSLRYGPDWSSWPQPLRDQEAAAITAVYDQHQSTIDIQIALQWLFDQQWQFVRTHAHSRGIELWGDVPFFAAGASSDTWWHRSLFQYDENAKIKFISGVPPDAFSDTGQLWGHPLYDEAAHAADQYRWWCQRFKAAFELVDRVRIDHFRGVAAYWEVPANANTALGGRWVSGPGQALLDALRNQFDQLPFIAEDLGVITDDVELLRDSNGLPGMAILQFAFGNPAQVDHPYLPHNHQRHLVVYPGTHDNDTSRGWYATAPEQTRDHLRRYLSVPGTDVAGDLIRCAYRSVANDAIVSMQDLLSLGAEARMNVPGEVDGNWAWRMRPEHLDSTLAKRWAQQVELTGRNFQKSYGR